MSATTAQAPKTVSLQLDDPLSSLFEPSYQGPAHQGPAHQSPAHQSPAGARSSRVFANSAIHPSHQAQTYIRQDVQPSFSDPLLQPTSTIATQFVPKEEFRRAKRSARDGWFAVMILSSFIALGTYWMVERVGGDATKINSLTTEVADLNNQLTAERGVLIARNGEIKLLNEQLADERRKISSTRRR